MHSSSDETLPINRNRLLAATEQFVPAQDRAAFLMATVFGADIFQADASPASSLSPADDTVASFALSVEQARELKGRLDSKSVDMIRTMVTNEKDEVATINWPEVKTITGVRDWSSFARGRLGGIHRSLRNLTGVPKDAVLIWEGDGWVEDGQGDYSAGLIGIDGPAIRSLRIALGLRD